MDRATRHTSSSASSTRVVDVLVPVALDQNYYYRVPRGMELKPGDVVCVPLGPREVVAVVWAENANPDPRLHNRLKDVGEKLDVPMREMGLARACPEGQSAALLPRTFPSRVPVFSLDRIYTRGLRCVSTTVPRGPSWARMSDHLPLVAEFELA